MKRQFKFPLSMISYFFRVMIVWLSVQGPWTIQMVNSRKGRMVPHPVQRLAKHVLRNERGPLGFMFNVIPLWI